VFVNDGFYGGTAFASVDIVQWDPQATEPRWFFQQMTGIPNVYSLDETITLSGPTSAELSVNVAKLVELHAVARKAVATIGDGSATSFTVAHTLGQDVTVSVRDTATGELVMAGVSCGVSSVTIDFASAPSADAYRVVIIG
jgi:hypothetical protein